MIKNFLTFFIPTLYLLAIMLINDTGKILGFGLVWATLGLFSTVLGCFLWLAGFINLGKNLTVLPKAKSLRTNGIYRFFRHPIYLGISLTVLGLSLSYGSFPGLIYFLLIILPLNILRANSEEKVLIQKFGDEYIEYKKKTIF